MINVCSNIQMRAGRKGDYGSTGGSVGEFRQLLDVFNRGLVKPVVDATFAMADISAAFAHLASGAQFGKISLVV
jgi:NADPH:quinone reductase-like Zn-dependent oxidoreductase